MSEATDPTTPTTAPAASASPAAQTKAEKREFAEKLRAQTVACRVRRSRFGVRRTFTPAQIRIAADEFGADSSVISAAKRVLDTRDPAWRAVSKLMGRAGHLWKALTVPYPEPGVRLLRRENVDMFVNQLKDIKALLVEAREQLQSKYEELRTRAQEKLGTLYNAGDYPDRIDVEFDLYWDFPSIEPPAYLKNLHPQLYEQEVERIRGRFEEAVRLTEQAFVEKFHELVGHLADRLKGTDDGKPKVFQDTSVTRLNAFFEEFRSLDVGSSGELQKVIDAAQNVVKGITPDELRGNLDLRSKVSDQLAAIEKEIGGLMVALPKRQMKLEDDEPAATDTKKNESEGGVAA
jgi:hypothetical protein